MRRRRRRIVGLTGFRGERAPAAVAVEENVVAELLVLLRRPQALAVVGLGLVARLAPHCRRMPPPPSYEQGRRSRSAEERGSEGDQVQEAGAGLLRSGVSAGRAVGRSFYRQTTVPEPEAPPPRAKPFLSLWPRNKQKALSSQGKKISSRYFGCCIMEKIESLLGRLFIMT
jgi:hypothetical protein